MPVRDDDLLRIKGFPQGINNVADEEALPRTKAGAPLAVREAVNVDLGTEGRPRRRRGYALAKALTRPHSGFGDWPDALLCVAGGDLIGLDAALGSSTIRAGIGEAAVSYAPVGEDCYWTNGTHLRKVTPALADAHAAVTCPAQPTVSAHSLGGLAAGEYQVAITCSDASGMESGSTLATVVNVPEGGGIRLADLVAGPEATHIRAYVSGANGTELYHARDIPVGVTQWIIGVGPRGKLLETQWLRPLRAGHLLRSYGGRLFVASENMVCWSDAYRYGLTRAEYYLRYATRVTMLEPTGQGAASGLYVAAGPRTLWLAGPDPKTWQQVIARPTGVVPGTGRQVPASWFALEGITGNVAFWMDTDGVFCLGLPSGQVMPLTEGRVALPAYAEGAVLLQEKPGIRQIIAALIGGGTNTFAASDSAVATVRKHGAAADL
jgi:hypothetical protein